LDEETITFSEQIGSNEILKGCGGMTNFCALPGWDMLKIKNTSLSYTTDM